MKNNAKIRCAAVAFSACLLLSGCVRQEEPTAADDDTALREEYAAFAEVLAKSLEMQESTSSCAHTRTRLVSDEKGHQLCCAACGAAVGATEKHFTDESNPFTRERSVGKYNVFVRVCASCGRRYEMILTEKGYTDFIDTYGQEAPQ